ncbi:uncharacterized protein LOC110728476 [Chenopodium quinoa]|uniref:uncharacterized protein LOC110728476 n=1 Tax=Chenopodium quinoa TaxID=63459 RepID=UPI000B797A6F|nr:uncharacterized protein LOC110728476 [Chenopodium quinoa]
MNEAYIFLKEFHIACAGMKPAGVTHYQLKLKAFHFALTDAAKEWLFELLAGTITTWTQMQEKFIEKYFPASLAANIRKEIWLTELDRNLIDAASGGALVKKTPEEAKTLIANIAANSQYRGGRNIKSTSVRQVNEATSNFNLRPPAFQQQLPSNPSPGFHQQPQHQSRPQNQQVSQPQSSSMFLEDIVKAMADNTLHFQQETRRGLKNLENQVSQLANTVGKLQAQNSNKLPSQPERNPKKNASAMSLRSGKQLEVPAKKTEGLAEYQEEQETIVQEKNEQPSKVSDVVSSKTDHFSSYVPFPSRLTSKRKKQEIEKEVLDVFRNVEMNIPLLEAIKQVPRYAKFLKDLCTNKRKLNGDEKVSVSENVSAVL